MSLTPRAEALLQAARRVDVAPTAPQRAKLLEAIRATAALPPAAPAAPAGKVAAAAKTGAVLKSVVIGVGLTVAAGGAWWGLTPAAQTTPPAPPVVERVAPPPVAASPQPVREEIKPAPVRPPPLPVRARPAPVATEPADELGPELEAMRQALRALDENRADDALAQARDAKKRWPQGAFRREADIIEVLALCARGDVDEAKLVARSLAAGGSDAAVLRRLERSCVAQ